MDARYGLATNVRTRLQQAEDRKKARMSEAHEQLALLQEASKVISEALENGVTRLNLPDYPSRLEVALTLSDLQIASDHVDEWRYKLQKMGAA